MTRSAGEWMETKHDKAKGVGFENDLPGVEHLISTEKYIRLSHQHS